MSHPQSYEILLLPEPEEPDDGPPDPGTALRSAVVAATGATGSSGYPRYEGGGMEADIDPATHTVEALLVDGSEIDYGLTVRLAERVRGTGGAEEPEDGDGPPERPEGGGATVAGGPGSR
ncbi:hypothetical protein ABZ172_02790 [Streptomyces sp. NPDC006296]|uniref:hypothetical protein n=1 Tax=Streptomyces sp. NPDC006296 TaxID=3156746 RepID=UPI0033A3C151